MSPLLLLSYYTLSCEWSVLLWGSHPYSSQTGSKLRQRPHSWATASHLTKATLAKTKETEMDSASSPCELCLSLSAAWSWCKPIHVITGMPIIGPGWVGPGAYAGPGGTTMDSQQVSLLAGPTQDWETVLTWVRRPTRCWCASSPPRRRGLPIKEQIQTCLKYTSIAQMMGWPLWVLEAAWNNKTTDKGWNPDTETTKRLFLLQWIKVADCLPPSPGHLVYELHPVIFFLPFLPAFS